MNSVTIQVVEEICAKLYIPFVRADFTKIDFEECFICSTSGGLTPVSHINNYEFKSSELTKRLQKEYARISG